MEKFTNLEAKGTEQLKRVVLSTELTITGELTYQEDSFIKVFSKYAEMAKREFEINEGRVATEEDIDEVLSKVYERVMNEIGRPRIAELKASLKSPEPVQSMPTPIVDTSFEEDVKEHQKAPEPVVEKTPEVVEETGDKMMDWYNNLMGKKVVPKGTLTPEPVVVTPIETVEPVVVAKPIIEESTLPEPAIAEPTPAPTPLPLHAKLVELGIVAPSVNTPMPAPIAEVSAEGFAQEEQFNNDTNLEAGQFDYKRPGIMPGDEIIAQSSHTRDYQGKWMGWNDEYEHIFIDYNGEQPNVDEHEFRAYDTHPDRHNVCINGSTALIRNGKKYIISSTGESIDMSMSINKMVALQKRVVNADNEILAPFIKR